MSSPGAQAAARTTATGHGVCCIVLLLAVALSASGCANSSATDAFTASGFLEAEEVIVAAETTARIAEVLVDRGATVQEGSVLIRLDDSVLRSQRLEAEAGLAAAQANLARIVAGPRQQEIDAGQAALSGAEALRDGAAQAVINAQDAISNPLQLIVDIDAARTQVNLAEQEVELAEAVLAEMELKHSVYTGKHAGDDTNRAWDLQLQATRAALAQAQASLDGAQSYLSSLYGIRDRPLSLQAELHAAKAEHRVAETQVDVAGAALAALEAGPPQEEVAIARAQVRQAEAAVHLIDASLAQLTLTAALEGTVTSRSAHTGETATAGAPLLAIASLDELLLTLYVPQTRIGRVHVGQEVMVVVDSFPGRAFAGRVATIANEAEFTPRNVQTEEERAKLVFAVEVRVPNAGHRLKPGMPADATITTQ